MADKYLLAFQTYRAEDKHECDLLSKRLSTFLTSQSFLVAGAAFLYTRIPNQPQDETRNLCLLGIMAFAAFLMVFLTSVAVCMGCRVLRQWHEHGKRLKEYVKEQQDTALEGHYLPNRSQPDIWHSFSMDAFNIFIPVIMGMVWLSILYYCVKDSDALTICVAALLIGWIAAMLWGFFGPAKLSDKNIFSSPQNRQDEKLAGSGQSATFLINLAQEIVLATFQFRVLANRAPSFEHSLRRRRWRGHGRIHRAGYGSRRRYSQRNTFADSAVQIANTSTSAATSPICPDQASPLKIP